MTTNYVTTPQGYRYYLTQRPPMPGALPRGAKEVRDFGKRQMVGSIGRMAWGEAIYEQPLTPEQVRDYELEPGFLAYINRETGELLTESGMKRQFQEMYDGGDPTNPLGWEEYFDEYQEVVVG